MSFLICPVCRQVCRQQHAHLLDDEGGDAVLVLLRLCLGIHNKHIRIGAIGDPELVFWVDEGGVGGSVAEQRLPT